MRLQLSDHSDNLSHLPALVVLGHKMYEHTCSFCCYAYFLHCCVYFCRFQEESDLLGLRLFVDEQSRLLRDFSEQLEQCVFTLKQDVAAIVRRKRERSGIWS